MGKSSKHKIFTYVQSGSLMKLKHYLEVQTKRNKSFDIDVKSGDQGRTSLHIACLLGDDAVVRCLLFYGAHGGARDKNNDTPLHLAARYVVDNFEDYKLLMEPLIRKFPDVVDATNNSNESPSSLLKEAKERHKLLKELENKPDEVGTVFVDREEKEEEVSNWEEKLAGAWENDLNDLGVAREQQFEDKQWEVPEYPTFDEWADRIAQEYKRKHWSDTEKMKRRKEMNRKRKIEEARDMTDRMLREEGRYRKKMAEKKRETLESKQREYKTKMGEHIANTSDVSRKLRFKDIPWPCRGPVSEMIEVILVGQPEQANERRKFILKQQILWHPDKFRQRCFNLLHDDDKDVVLETVNLLSQLLNNSLSEC